MTVLADVRHVARVPHFCDFCDRRIQPGETYRRVRAIGEDGPYTYRECAHCSAFIKACPLWDLFGDDDYGIEPSLIRVGSHEWEPQDEFCQEMQRQFTARWRLPSSVELYPIPPSEHSGKCF